MRSCSIRALFALGCVLPGFAAAQSVSVTGGAPQTQTFDSLSSSTSIASSSLPTGWVLAESGSNANTTYLGDNGGGPSGNTYSYGTSGSGERAFGTLRSNSLAPTIGARLQNDTGSTLAELQVEYEGEQWRIGTQSRADRLDFEYSLNATSLTTGTWVPVDALDFTSPNTTSTAGALDGNLAANGASKSAIITGLTLANGATMWVRWSDFDPGTNEDGLAIDNVVFSVPGDSPPALGSSSPADAATGVARNQSLSLVFTEPVTVAGAWFDITCTSSGAHPASVTGSGASYALDPAVDFAYDEDCTLTLDPTRITDNDPPADPLGGNTRISFHTEVEQVDVPPSVESVVPAPGATGVSPSASLTVKFSEPVTAPASAFALTCINSGMHAFTLSGGPGTFGLDPAVDFAELETCSLAIDAEQVFDQDGTAAAMVADFLASFTTRAGSGTYYNGVDASSCVALRTTLHALIDDHTAFTYSQAWAILEEADQDPSNSSRILDVYRNQTYAKVTDRATGTTPGSSLTAYNREHTWPNSHGFNDVLTLDGFPYSPFTDAHMLYLSAVGYNTNRGNKYYAECAACSEDATVSYGGFGGGTGVYPGNSNWSGGAQYQVWNHRKGDMARAILYMDVRYQGDSHANGQREPDLIVTDTASLADDTTASGQYAPVGYMGLRSELMAWHEADPPDANEELRNDVVFSYQQNRNPFIDHPEWVAIAFAEPCTGSAPTNQAPVLADSNATVLENVANGTTVATLSATDPNAGQMLSYSIQSGNANGAFAINAGTGAITVANTALIDRAVAASYSLTVRATDNGTPVLSDDATLSITITQVNDAPSFTKGADVVVAEDSGAASLAGWATGISAGPSDESAQTVSFELTANTAASLFSAGPAIASNGTLTFTPAPDANGTRTITLLARDTGGTANGGVDASSGQTFTITITPVNDLGVANDDSPAAIPEDAGTTTIDVLANDVDPDGGSFVQTVGPASGGTTAVGPAGTSATFTPDANFCGATSFTYTIDGGDSAVVNIVVACINDAPVAVDANASIPAGSVAGTPVATVAASDVDSALLSFAIASGNTGGAFAIDPATGAITVATPAALITGNSPFVLVVTVGDDSVPVQYDTATITIAVTPSGEAIFANGFE